MVYRRGRRANCDIYIKQIGVEPPSRLTTDPAEDFSPAWSPDGRFIAFLRQLSPSRAALMLIPQRGGQERVLGEFDVTHADLLWLDLTWPGRRTRNGWSSLSRARQGRPGLVCCSLWRHWRKKTDDSAAGALDDYSRVFAGRPDPGVHALERERHRISACSALGRTTSRKESLEGLLNGEARIVSARPGRRMGARSCSVQAVPLATGGSLWRMAASASAKPRRLAFASENARGAGDLPARQPSGVCTARKCESQHLAC